jgi:formiminotetrahydrofolate cyclodeaminase
LASSDPLQRTVASFLDDVAAETSAPGGGAVAAVAVALAAALAEMAARFSVRSWDGAGEALASAQALRARAAPLAQADAEAFADYLAARRRGAGIEAAAARAVAVPLTIAECGSEVAELAASLVEHGNQTLRGDAIAAAQAARAGAAIAAKLVEINVGGGPDERLDRARAHAAAAGSAAERAAG